MERNGGQKKYIFSDSDVPKILLPGVKISSHCVKGGRILQVCTIYTAEILL
jgi:hypothetical protein